MASASASAASESLSILSPFDEKEEWHKISEILNSFGSNIGKDVKASTDGGTNVDITFQVADKITQPLGSVTRLCEAGNRVVFDK